MPPGADAEAGDLPPERAVQRVLDPEMFRDCAAMDGATPPPKISPAPITRPATDAISPTGAASAGIGRALISGKCYDVGSIVMGQLRGLAARAPYFSNGSAEDLRAVVDFYDRRFNMGLSQREKDDLVNFLSVL